MAELSATLADASLLPLRWVSTLSGTFASSFAFSFAPNLPKPSMGSRALEVDFHELLGVRLREVVGIQTRNIVITWELEVTLFILVSPLLLLLFLVTRAVLFFLGLSYGLLILSSVPGTAASALFAVTALVS